MSSDNLLLLTDSYKVSHWKQYPEGTTNVYSYFESRGGLYANTLFFGLQYIIKKHLIGKVVTLEKIKEAKELYAAHFNNDSIFNEEAWQYIHEKHDGFLPVRIKAVPEGTFLPYRNVLFTVENTDPNCFWLPSYLETLFVQAWYPMTVATNSFYQKGIICDYLTRTADSIDNLLFKLIDFGFRGSTSVESAGIGGMAHLVNFTVSDTVIALVFARQYYACDMAGFAIPASEHSSITCWGEKHEKDAFANMLRSFPNGVVACVSDSYNIFEACEKIWGEELKEMVLERSRTPGNVLVIRPDSGDPATVVLKILEILGKKFGFSVNSKGFKMLPPYLRIIQGDGVSATVLKHVLQTLYEHEWSAENVTFGSGGALLQNFDRDTQKCAYKCSQVVVNGTSRNVFKDPVTDSVKKSKKGRLTLEYYDGSYITHVEGKGNPEKDILVPVFENGVLLQDFSFDEVRKRSENFLPLVSNSTQLS